MKSPSFPIVATWPNGCCRDPVVAAAKLDKSAVFLRAADLLLTQAVSVLAKECIDFLDCRDVWDTTEQLEE